MPVEISDCSLKTLKQKQKAVKLLSEVLMMTEEPRTSTESRAESIFGYVSGKFLKHFC